MQTYVGCLLSDSTGYFVIACQTNRQFAGDMLVFRDYEHCESAKETLGLRHSGSRECALVDKE